MKDIITGENKVIKYLEDRDVSACERECALLFCSVLNGTLKVDVFSPCLCL